LQENGPPKQTEIARLLLAKLDFKSKLVIRDKEVHFILIKGTILQQEITIVNIYVPNFSAPNFIKHVLLDLKDRSQQTTVGDFNTPLPQTDRSYRQRINKETSELNDSMDKWT
jgi:hypothetical protein